LKVEVIYLFTNNNEFKISYFAETDQATHVNLTHHSYFNLNGCKSNILSHEIRIDSLQVTEVNESLIPTGNIKNIKNTVMDLATLKPLGPQISAMEEKGFDHNFILKNDNTLQLIAKVYEPQGGRIMEVLTTEPAVQFYSGNYIGKITGKKGVQYDDFFGLCLETQHYPDSPNKPDFPSTLLRPGEKYRSETIYQFSIE